MGRGPRTLINDVIVAGVRCDSKSKKSQANDRDNSYGKNDHLFLRENPAMPAPEDVVGQRRMDTQVLAVRVRNY
jgi:hypothetical protein